MIPNLKQTKPILCVYLPQPRHVAAAAVLPRYHLTNGFWEDPDIRDVCFGNKFHVLYLSVQTMNFSTNMKFHKIGNQHTYLLHSLNHGSLLRWLMKTLHDFLFWRLLYLQCYKEK
jgi:hypothetical protein